MELASLSEPSTSSNPKARAAELQDDSSRKRWREQVSAFALKLPELGQDEAKVQFEELLAAQDSRVVGWPNPIPLPLTNFPVEPFEPELLPDKLRSFVMDVAERTQCPPDFTAVATMVALGSVAGRQVEIRPKQKNDWGIVPNLWGAGVGSPGAKKTPSMQPVLDFIWQLDIAAGEKFKVEQAAFERELEVLEISRKAAGKNALKEAKNGKDAIRAALDASSIESSVPTRRCFIINDSTIEKVGEQLRDNPNGFLMFRDELAGWLSGFERAGHEQDRAFFLEAATGKGRFKYSRIKRGDVEIQGMCISVLGTIQPALLSEYFRSATQNGAGSDGLIQRIQLGVWPDISSEFKNVDRWPDTKARNLAFATFDRFSNLEPTHISAQAEHLGGLPFLRFSPEAQAEFDAWQVDLYSRLRTSNENEAFVGHLAKYEKLVAGLALLIHLVDCPLGGPISHSALQRAIAWQEYLESHARRIYGFGTSGDVEAARALIRHIQNGDLPAPFTARDVYKNHWANLARPAMAEAALKVLEDFNWVRGYPVHTQGRSTTHYIVHPSIRAKR